MSEYAEASGEYVCVVEPDDAAGQERMTILAEASDTSVDRDSLRGALVQRFHEALGVKLAVEIVDKGSLAAMTGLTDVMKVRRLIDKRKN